MKLAATLLAALFSFGRSGPVQESDAEKLFKKMEERLANAKTLQFSAKMTTDGDPPESIEAKFLLAEGNKARLDLKITRGEAGEEVLCVSDGKFMTDVKKGQSSDPQAAAPELNAVLKIGIARADAGFVYRYSRLKSRDEALKSMPVSDFKSGGKDKVGEIEAEIVEYTVEMPRVGKMTAKVWIDPQRLIPLRRTMSGVRKDKIATGTSVYEGFKIDEPIDDAKFKLP